MKLFNAHKTRMIGLPYGEKNYDNMLNRFHPIPERYGRTDRQTDRRTDRIPISISRVSMLTHDKNAEKRCSDLILALWKMNRTDDSTTATTYDGFCNNARNVCNRLA